ncbi:MAG: putative quinol monooxygenase [Alphaproteobacteria bacterium]
MSRIALVVTVDVADGQRDALLDILRHHAARSLSLETGCLQFDILLPEDKPGRIMIFELYRNPAALEAHRASEHLKRWRTESASIPHTIDVVVCQA